MNPLEEHEANCPYCGEAIQLLVDIADMNSDYTEDCQVCCRPMIVRIYEDQAVTVLREDDI